MDRRKSWEIHTKSPFCVPLAEPSAIDLDAHHYAPWKDYITIHAHCRLRGYSPKKPSPCPSLIMSFSPSTALLRGRCVIFRKGSKTVLIL